MGNLIDYLSWRGNLSFDAVPFCDMDSMVLCSLSYIDFSSVLAKEDNMSFVEAVSKLKEKETPRFLALDYPFKKELYAKFLEAVLQSVRFKNLAIHDYVDVHDEKLTTQFSAVSFTLKEGEEAIAYRGTDESLVGWKEDCMLSFMKTPCQEQALSYLEEMLSKTNKAYVMGHSKGSNLALFSTLNCSKEELDKIELIYLLDGPGLSKDVFPEVATHRIDDKVRAYEPEYDVVAKIFKMDFSSTTILKSSERGIMSHGILSWQIENGSFSVAEKNDPNAVWIQRTLDALIENLSPKEKESFIDTMFDALSKNGAKTLFELGKDPAKTFENVLVKTFHVSRKNEKARRKVTLSLFFGSSVHDLKSINKISEFFLSNMFYGLVMIFFGIIFLVIPSSALPITATVIVSALLLLELVLCIFYLIKVKWNFKSQKMRLLFLLFSSILYGALWAKEGNIDFFANWFFGIFFLIFAILMSVSLPRTRKKSLFDFIWNIVEIALYFAIGCYILFAPERFLAIGTFATGCVLVADGAIKIIR